MKELSIMELKRKEEVFEVSFNDDVKRMIKRDLIIKALCKCPYEAEECINRNTKDRNKCNSLWNIRFAGKCPFYTDFREMEKELFDEEYRKETEENDELSR